MLILIGAKVGNGQVGLPVVVLASSPEGFPVVVELTGGIVGIEGNDGIPGALGVETFNGGRVVAFNGGRVVDTPGAGVEESSL